MGKNGGEGERERGRGWSGIALMLGVGEVYENQKGGGTGRGSAPYIYWVNIKKGCSHSAEL